MSGDNCVRDIRLGSVVQILLRLAIKAAWNCNCASINLGIRIVYVRGYCVLSVERIWSRRFCSNNIIQLQVLISNGNK